MIKLSDDDDELPRHHAVPNIRRLRVLEAVARHESISRAASEVGLSQSAISQALARIEEEVGRPLFDRAQSGTYLAPAGHTYLQRVRRLLTQVDQALRDVDGTRNARQRIYHISSAQVRCLLALSGSASFSAGARSIGVSTSSLHRVARELEAGLGAELYRPTRNGLQLSDAGAELARRLRLAIREIEAARDDLRFLDGVESGQITIGTLPMSGAYFVGRTVARLTDMLPYARVHISSAPFNAQINSLRSGEIDMIFGVLRRPSWAADLAEEPLFSDPYCIVVRAGHPLEARTDLTADDLMRYEWVVPMSGSPRRVQFDQLFGVGIRPKMGIETSSLTAILSVLSCTDRISLLSRHEVGTVHSADLFSILDWPDRFTPVAKGITTRADWLPTPVQNRFLELLRAQAADVSANHT